jgi:hypothetical protein
VSGLRHERLRPLDVVGVDRELRIEREIARRLKALRPVGGVAQEGRRHARFVDRVLDCLAHAHILEDRVLHVEVDVPDVRDLPPITDRQGVALVDQALD